MGLFQVSAIRLWLSDGPSFKDAFCNLLRTVFDYNNMYVVFKRVLTSIKHIDVQHWSSNGSLLDDINIL